MINLNSLEKAFQYNQFEPCIRHIRFPYFKNLTPYLKIEFKFPITALVGPNGSNKSSVLRAIACCPHFQNLGEYWFSTDIDPIDESGGRPRYIFGYKDNHSKRVVEVIQARIMKSNDPDYWEPSRPLVSDGMEKLEPLPKGKKIPGRVKTRWEGIKKKVIILDFRSEISAFDKLFYHGHVIETLRNKKPKDLLRARSTLLKKVIDKNSSTLKPFKGRKEQIFSNKELNASEVKTISNIIGRNYKSIKLIRHNLFDNSSYTAIIKTDELNYSEAFAGSGEFAVIMLVHKVMNADERSLIILDEPEVSLHPGAQIKLVEFLAEQCSEKKHQIFLGTHSKFIIDQLPESAIVLLQQDPSTGKIIAQQNIKPSEAFFHLGLMSQHKKKIFVEDRLAAEIVKKALRRLGAAALDQFEVVPYPGGAKTIFSKCMPSLLQANEKNTLFLLDGDQRPSKEIIHPKDIPIHDRQEVKTQILSLTGIKDPIEFSLNGGNDPKHEETRNKIERDFLDYALSRIYYLPADNPEDFIWQNMKQCDHSRECASEQIKQRYVKLTKLEKGLIDTENVTAEEILETQIRKLATISPENPGIVELSKHLKSHIN